MASPAISIFNILDRFSGNKYNIDLKKLILQIKDNLVKCQLLMLFVEGQAKAILDDFEDLWGKPQDYDDLVIKLLEVCDSVVNQEGKKIQFENWMQKLNESEDEFMFELVKLYHTANANIATASLNSIVKRKF